MSRLPFELLLALRYLRPKRTFVSIITLISVLGVTLGVGVLIIVISVMTGFDEELRDKLFGFNAHLTIYQVNPQDGRLALMTNAPAAMKIVQSNPNVKGCTPYVLSQIVLATEPEHGESQIQAPFLRGVDIRQNNSLGLITSNVITGTNNLSGRGLLLGTSLAERMNTFVGDRVTIFTPSEIKKMMDSKTNGHETAVVPEDFEVRGIFSSGFEEYNSTVVVSSLTSAQDIFKLDDNVQGLMVMLKDPYEARQVGADLQKSLGKSFEIRSWDQENSGMMAVMVEKNVMLYILFFIVIVAAFGITCTLVTFVVLKTREIGVMKALGATSTQIMWIFLSQSLIVSLWGVMIGTGIGTLAVAYRNEFLRLMRRLTGMELFPSKIYLFTELPAKIIPGDLLIICGGSLLICLLAAVFPVWNASRLKPVEALRHE